MLETGLALISLNLPPTWSFFSQFSIGSVLHSLRSLFSVHSRSSNSSSSTQLDKPNGHVNMHDGPEAGSQDVELVPHRTLAEFDNKVEGQCGMNQYQARENLDGSINVHTSVEQTEFRIV